MKNQSGSSYTKIFFILTQSKQNVKTEKSNQKYTALYVRAIELKMSKRKKKKRQLITDYLQFRTCIHINNSITQCCGCILGEM